MKKVFLSVAMITALLSSCGTARKSVSLAGEWNIVSVKGQEVSSDNDPFIGFDVAEGRLYGNAGCNNIMATLSLDSVKGKVTLSEVGATRKMCRDMKLEGEVLDALSKVSAYEATEAGVTLNDADGNVLISLEKKDAPAVSISDLQGEWLIASVEGKAVEVVEKTPFIVFDLDENIVYGTGGCNSFNGAFSQEENKPASFRFGDLATTMMAGPGLEQEGVVMAALAKVRSFAVNADGSVSLMDENQKEAVLLKKNGGKSLAQ